MDRLFTYAFQLMGARAANSWERTSNAVDKLIAGTIQTGAITVMAAAVDLALFVKLTRGNFHLTPYVTGYLSLCRRDD